MKLLSFDNKNGEGIVSFEPWKTMGPEFDQDISRWYCHLKIEDNRIFEYGCPCGTCGIIFRKLESSKNRITDSEAVELLGNLDSIPDQASLEKLARILEAGSYNLAILENPVKFIRPGDPDDYFSTDVVKLSGFEPPDYKEPGGPETAYYRFGSDSVLGRTDWIGDPYKALITSVVMPTQNVESLNRERIEYWKEQYSKGVNLTAFAVSVIDNQATATSPYDENYEYNEQFLFTHCLIDGHHRTQAASELGVPLRILSFITQEYSLVRNKEDIPTVINRYTQQFTT